VTAREVLVQLSLKSLPRDETIRVSNTILGRLFSHYPRRNFRVRLWDGSVWGECQNPSFTLVLEHPGSLRVMFLSPNDVTLGEAYIYGDFDIEGDISAVFPLGEYLLEAGPKGKERLELMSLLHKLPRMRAPREGYAAARPRGWLHSRERDRQSISYHYDLPVEFYQLFLDPRLVYSCAYFESEDDNLDLAQERKLDYICRKLRLQGGERLLDIGCGWGGLIMHAAAACGVDATGVTISGPQAAVAHERIHQAGLGSICRVEERDYRDLEASVPFDKIVSVGMFEHVGESHLPEYFNRAWRLLRPGGVFLNHGIASSATHPHTGPSFSLSYVFPDSELVPISTTLRVAEAAGFEVRDVESLREHYALTLDHWVRRLESRAADARRIAGEPAYRAWRLCLAGAAHRFRIGQLNLYQTLLAKPADGRCRLPLTRRDWYQS
jgi:cyclopropane-fatty-acyl-phospholipid synthase